MVTVEKRLPTLYPVACFVTGSTPNGGGLWKYILRLFPESLLRSNRPTMSQALHFLDFKISPKNLREFWRTRPLREHYNGQFGLDFKAPLFIDSGGFTLMYDPDLDLSLFGITKDRLPEEILRLQLDYGADYVVSLDYPIPPNLEEEEARDRQSKTLDSAIRSAKSLKSYTSEKKPKLYIPIHGLTVESLRTFTENLLDKLAKENLMDVIEGLALGSMVPRRKNGNSDEVLSFARAARSVMPAEMPLHIFGISGALMPFLVAEGVNSFDTSGYVQNGRSLRYFDPETRHLIPFRKLRKYPCDCSICRDRDIKTDKKTLDGKTNLEKSSVYAAICLHNLEVEYRLLDSVKRALEENSLESYLQQLPEMYPNLRWPIQHIDAKKQQALLSKPSTNNKVYAHKPEDFDLRTLSWIPNAFRKIALILPCSQEKPYTNSQTYRRVWNYLSQRLNSVDLSAVDVIFLSGLYGPVPTLFVQDEAVLTYDFRLHKRDLKGISRVTERLCAFLSQHNKNYKGVIGYITQPAYRKAFSQASLSLNNIHLLPEGRMSISNFSKRSNLVLLAEKIEMLLED